MIAELAAEALLQGTLVAAGALLVSKLLGPRWPRVRYGVLQLALLKLAIPPVVGSPLAVLPAASGLLGGAAASGAPAPIWPAAVLGLYLLGSLMVAAGLVVQLVALGRLRRRCVPAPRDPFGPVVEDLRRRLGLRRRPRVLLAPETTRPFAVGVFRPVVVLPRGVAGRLGPAALRHVLAHELLHVARGHLPGNALRALLAVVWWPHPLFWWLARESRRAAEESCDDGAIGVTGAPPHEYGRSLVEALRAGSSAPIPAWASAVGAESAGLEPRLRRLQVRREPGRLAVWAGRMVLAVAGVALLTVPSAGAPAAPAPPAAAGEGTQVRVPFLHEHGHAARHRAIHSTGHDGPGGHP